MARGPCSTADAVSAAVSGRQCDVRSRFARARAMAWPMPALAPVTSAFAAQSKGLAMPLLVIPAHAGIQTDSEQSGLTWIPAFAGMTQGGGVSSLKLAESSTFMSV